MVPDRLHGTLHTPTTIHRIDMANNQPLQRASDSKGKEKAVEPPNSSSPRELSSPGENCDHDETVSIATPTPKWDEISQDERDSITYLLNLAQNAMDSSISGSRSSMERDATPEPPSSAGRKRPASTEDLPRAMTKRSKKYTCSHCHQAGHRKPNCPQLTKPGISNKRTCANCHDEGHLKPTCPQLPCRTCNQMGHSAGKCPVTREKRGNEKI